MTDSNKNNITGLAHFVHIGYPKTASTWLQDLFAQHPEICFAYKPKFFSCDDCFFRGKEFYQSFFHPEVGHKVILESDEAYSIGRRRQAFGWDCCYKPRRSAGWREWKEAAAKAIMPPDIKLIAERIHQTVPQAKIIMVLRNQADWLSSAYKHQVSARKGEPRSFKEFLDSSGYPYLGEEFKSAGFYSLIVELYFKLFGRENVLVLFYEELKNNPVSFLDRISNFLGISKFNYSQISRKAKVSMTNRGARLLQKVHCVAGRFPFAFKLVSCIDGRIFSKMKDIELISQEEKQALRDLYAKDNEKLAELLNGQALYK